MFIIFHFFLGLFVIFRLHVMLYKSRPCLVLSFSRVPGRMSEEEEAREFCQKYGVKYVRGAEIYEVGGHACTILL